MGNAHSDENLKCHSLPNSPRLPASYGKHGVSNIPSFPATAPKKSSGGANRFSSSSSCSISPLAPNSASQLPASRASQFGRSSLNEKHFSGKELLGNLHNPSINSRPLPNPRANVLDKLKLFHQKEVRMETKLKGTSFCSDVSDSSAAVSKMYPISKRTSNSSGCSSAHSERSNSSTGVTTPMMGPHFHGDSASVVHSSVTDSVYPSFLTSNPVEESSRAVCKGMRSKASKTAAVKSRSPRTAHKECKTREEDSVLTSIPKPIAAIRGTSKSNNTNRALNESQEMSNVSSETDLRNAPITLPFQKPQLPKESGPSIAFVSPMPSNSLTKSISTSKAEKVEKETETIIPMVPLTASHYGYGKTNTHQSMDADSTKIKTNSRMEGSQFDKSYICGEESNQSIIHQKMKRLDDTSSMSSGLSELNDFSTDDVSSSLTSETSGGQAILTSPYHSSISGIIKKKDYSQQTENIISTSALGDSKNESLLKNNLLLTDCKKVSNIIPSKQISTSTPIKNVSHFDTSFENSKMTQVTTVPYESDKSHTKFKMCARTQTENCSIPNFIRSGEDVQHTGSLGRRQNFKSFSMNTSTAAQLSHGIKERLMLNSGRDISPCATSVLNWQQGNNTDGSLSDSMYCTYADLTNESRIIHGRVNSLPIERRIFNSEEHSPRLMRGPSIRTYIFDRNSGNRMEANKCEISSPITSELPKLSYALTPITAAKSSVRDRLSSSKDDEAHFPISSHSSLVRISEERQLYHLQKELEESKQKEINLKQQLHTHNHLVKVYEQSLSSMTSRLQQLSATSEQKDFQLQQLRQKINCLLKESDNSAKGHLSADSLTSLSSACSVNSTASQQGDSFEANKKKKKGWLRSSFTRAFSRSKKANKQASDLEEVTSQLTDETSSNISPPSDVDVSVVNDLKRRLAEKDMALTDIRLEALGSAHQVESLRETVHKMKNEMQLLRQDNERLQKLLTSKSLTSSLTSMSNCMEHRFSLTESVQTTDFGELSTDIVPGTCDQEGKLISVEVYLGCHGNIQYYQEMNRPACKIGILRIGTKTYWPLLDNLIDQVFLDYLKQIDPACSLDLNGNAIICYEVGELIRNPGSKQLPELLPFGYLVGDLNSIFVCLRGAIHEQSLDALAFDILIPKTIIQQYVTLLNDSNCVVFYGQNKTGKSYVAQKIAEFYIWCKGKEPNSKCLSTLHVEHKNDKEFCQIFNQILEQHFISIEALLAIVVDNLKHVNALHELLNSLSPNSVHLPVIIGTMNSMVTTDTHFHNIQFLSYTNHAEPVRGFLARYLQRQLIISEVTAGKRNPPLSRVLNWVPKVWAQINRFLDIYISSESNTIGPCLFLSCPVDALESQVWFTDLWNYSLLPYLKEFVQNKANQEIKMSQFQEDPIKWIQESYPWAHEGLYSELHTLKPEDLICTFETTTEVSNCNRTMHQKDPLLSMLLQLQEATTNYSNSVDNGNVK